MHNGCWNGGVAGAARQWFATEGVVAMQLGAASFKQELQLEARFVANLANAGEFVIGLAAVDCRSEVCRDVCCT